MSAADLSSALFSVTTPTDSLASGSLRNAIILASDTHNSGTSSTITFNLTPPTGIINLVDSLPPIGSLASSPAVAITIDMNGNNVVIDSNIFSGLFVLPNTTFTLLDSVGGGVMEMSTASVGGNGGVSGGGGGLGAGGGLLVQGTSTISATFLLTNCAAQGGLGANAGNSAAGGGGRGDGQRFWSICRRRERWRRRRRIRVDGIWGASSAIGGGGGGGGMGVQGFGGPSMHIGGGGGGSNLNGR